MGEGTDGRPNGSPWNAALRRVAKAGLALSIPLLRLRAQARLSRLDPGVTIVTVNWNSLPFLQVFMAAVRHFSPPEVRIIVVDNGSRDSSRQWLRQQQDVKVLRLPTNVGHGRALDCGFLLCRTTHVVAMDVDAFPLRPGWLDELLNPLAAGAAVAGAHHGWDFVHPCCLAMEMRRFVERRLSFAERVRPVRADVAHLLNAHAGGPLHFIEATNIRGPGFTGIVFGDIVYHNFYATRFRTTDDELLDEVVRREDAAAAWKEAVATHLAGVPGIPSV